LAQSLLSQNNSKAAEWLEKAAFSGHAGAQCLLAQQYKNGLGRERNPLYSLHWYINASQQGQLSALKGLLEFIEKDADALKLSLLVNAAQAGDAESQYRLAQQYAQSQFGSQVDALRWLEVAAAQGYAPAQAELGLQYLSGKNSERNPAKAVEWLQLAASQGDARAQWNLGSLYASGATGVTKDVVLAFEWCHRAANLEFVPAQATLGVLYARMGEHARALHWLKLAAGNGDAEAQFNLASALAKGPDGTPDMQSAFHWFYAAACQGLAPAQVKVGILYATGEGVAQDAIEAHKWFVLAARHGDRAANANLVKSTQQITQDQAIEAVRRADAFKFVVPQ